MANYKSETEQEITRFIKILIGVVIVVLGVYFFTNNFVSKEAKEKEEVTETEINPTKIIVGSILNRDEEEYYVLAYKSEEANGSLYNAYLETYKNKEDSLSIYEVDLDNYLNSSYYAEEANTNVENIKDIKLSSPTLLKIKSHKIVKAVYSNEDIKKELGF